MASSLNRRFAETMTLLEDTDPESYRTIKAKLEALKSESATWRRKAQSSSDHGETPKMALDSEGGQQ